MKKIWAKPEWQVTIIYTIFGSLWIFCSDWLLAFLVPDPVKQFQLQHYKGLFFVFLSALLIFFVLRNALHRRMDEQEKFQKIFETSLDGILLTSPDGPILEANPAACRMFGMTEEEIIRGGRNALVDTHDPLVVKAIEERQKNGFFIGELTFIRKNGEKFPVAISSVLFKDRKGNNRTVMVIHDITNRKKSEQALASFNNQLEKEIRLKTEQLKEANESFLQQERLATFGRLANGVATELRNPLGVITNSIYYLHLIQPDANVKVKEYLGLVERESQRAIQIISDLLNFANVQSGDRQHVSVASLIHQVILSNAVPENIELNIEVMDNLPEVFIDVHQLEHALGKLIINSYEAMGAGGNITISAKKGSGELKSFVILTIRDSGPGVPEEDMEHLFEPLFTTKPRHIGLGLPLSRRLIEVNGGSLEIISESGKGVKDVIHLPIIMET